MDDHCQRDPGDKTISLSPKAAANYFLHFCIAIKLFYDELYFLINKTKYKAQQLTKEALTKRTDMFDCLI